MGYAFGIWYPVKSLFSFYNLGYPDGKCVSQDTQMKNADPFSKNGQKFETEYSCCFIKKKKGIFVTFSMCNSA